MSKLLLLLLLLISCEAIEENKRHNEWASSSSVVVIDGCQYLKGNWSQEAPIIHKGDCNNPIHNNNGTK